MNPSSGRTKTIAAIGDRDFVGGNYLPRFCLNVSCGHPKLLTKTNIRISSVSPHARSGCGSGVLCGMDRHIAKISTRTRIGCIRHHFLLTTGDILKSGLARADAVNKCNVAYASSHANRRRCAPLHMSRA